MNAPLFPDHPFWDFSLKLYSQPEVTQTCLQLQDSCQLNINLLLFCCWTGFSAKKLSIETLNKAVAATSSWQTEAIQPLRAIRRRLKQEFSEIPVQRSDYLRKNLQQLEIDAEHCEQLLLAETIILSGETTASPEQKAQAVIDNLYNYLNVANVERSEKICDQLKILITTCFPELDASIIKQLFRRK